MDNDIRATLWNGGLYVIRDVFDENGKLKTCEYAAQPYLSMADDSIVWVPCSEGVEFADIEPLGGTV